MRVLEGAFNVQVRGRDLLCDQVQHVDPFLSGFQRFAAEIVQHLIGLDADDREDDHFRFRLTSLLNRPW